MDLFDLPSTRNYTRRSPCRSCPFRTDAKLAYWAPQEYLMLLTNLRRETTDEATLFDCHADRKLPTERRSVCLGWVLEQQNRNVPNVRLRAALKRNPQLREQCRAAHCDVPLYPSIEALVAANFVQDGRLYPERYQETPWFLELQRLVLRAETPDAPARRQRRYRWRK